MLRKKSYSVNPSTRSKVSASERKQKSQSSYLQLMHNIAADLGVMLDDLCPEPDEKSRKNDSSLILTPTKVQAPSHEKPPPNIGIFTPINTGMFEPATRNKSLNELQAERKQQFINDVSSSQSSNQIFNTGVSNQAQHGFSSNFASSGQSNPMVSQGLSSPFYGQAIPNSLSGFTDGSTTSDASLTLMDRLELTRDIWYQPNRPKAEAIKALQLAPLGSFIVRGSKVKGQLSLLVHQNSEKSGFYIENYPVRLHPDNKVVLVKSEQEYESITQLVVQHMTTAGCLPVVLRLPSPVMAANNSEDLKHLTFEGVWRNSQSFLQEDSNQNLKIPCRTMMRVQSTPQIDYHYDTDRKLSLQPTTNLIDLSNQMSIRRSTSYSENTNPFVNVQQTTDTVAQTSDFTHQSKQLHFRPNSDNFFYAPPNANRDSSQSLNLPFPSIPVCSTQSSERDSGLPDHEMQRLSVSTDAPYFDPRDSGFGPEVILPSVASKKSVEPNNEESITSRKREKSLLKQPSLDSLDESSASSGERFSLISTSSNEDGAKYSSSKPTVSDKPAKTHKFSKRRSIQKIINISKRKIKREWKSRRKDHSDDKVDGDAAEEAAECIEKTILRRSHESGTFLKETIDAFIESKKKKTEEKPEKMMHSIRGLIGGIKRNLVTMQNDPVIKEVVQQNSHKLNQEVEEIIEAALYQRILIPLKETIYANYHYEYKKNGSIALIEDKMAVARLQTKEQLGISANVLPPNEDQMKIIKECFGSLRNAYSPYDKMDLILKAVTHIYDFVGDNEHGRAVQSMGADEFLPMLIYTLVQCNITTIEIETDYIWSLLDSTAFTGEPAYYLTTLTSAVHVLKNVEFEDVIEEDDNKDTDTQDDVDLEDFSFTHRSSSVSGTKGFLEVFVTVSSGEFQEKMLPLWPGMTTKQICRNLTLKNHIEEKEWENFGLFKLERNKEGQVKKETLLHDNECPQRVKDEMTHSGILCDFGFKHKYYRVDWPLNTKLAAELKSDESEDESEA
ncbi:uncharacterized protein [Antedon mediterranea]|uniref:uncharacterized protein isoform X2 n=1 Tax=Antedon mediterranea TaxID=105859 RepID=UPI003AF99964